MPELSTNLEKNFLQQIKENPDDSHYRLVYADYLEENGNTDLAEFLRAQVELEKRHWPVLVKMWDAKPEIVPDLNVNWFGETEPIDYVERNEYRLKGKAILPEVLVSMISMGGLDFDIGKIGHFPPTYVTVEYPVVENDRRKWVSNGYWQGYFEGNAQALYGMPPGSYAVGNVSFRTNAYFLDPPEDVQLILKEEELRENLFYSKEILHVLERRTGRHRN